MFANCRTLELLVYLNFHIVDLESLLIVQCCTDLEGGGGGGGDGGTAAAAAAADGTC